MKGWAVTLVSMLLLTAAMTVGYALAPFDPPPNEEADTGSPGTVEAGHRIVAISDAGLLVVLDESSGRLSEEVVDVGAADALALGADQEAAFVAVDDGIRLVHLRSGRTERHGPGRSPELGPMAFSQLARSVPRPEVERLVTVGRHGDIVVENTVTGDRSSLPAAGAELGGIDDLVASPFDDLLYGVADGGRTLFRLDLSRDDDLGDAVARTLDDATIIDAAARDDGLVAIVERGGERSIRLVSRQLELGDEIVHGPWPAPPRSLDTDATTRRLLVTTEGDELLAVLDGDDRPEHLADGVRVARW